MVTARHPLAAEAGCEVLRQGGNAVDAAVAASFVGSVVQPVANTIGGGGLLVVRDPEASEAFIDYRYQAPIRATADMFTPVTRGPTSDLFGWSGVSGAANGVGHLAVAAPGSVAGLARAVERFGRRSLSDVMGPAIGLAEDGFEVDWYGSLMQGIHLDILTRFPITARTFLRDGRYPYRPRVLGHGDRLRQPELAAQLRRIAENGPRAFYEGEAAETLVRDVAAGGGILELPDLVGFEPREAQPRRVTFRGHTVLGPQNMAVWVQLVQILEHFDLSSLEPDAPRRLHLIAEILNRVRGDQLRYYGDLEQIDAPWSELSSTEHAAYLATSIDPTRRTDPPSDRIAVAHGPGPAPNVEDAEHTVHISAVDERGMMASLTETILGDFGSGVTTETGVLLNNGLVGFNPEPGHPNSVGPRKRPVSFMTPLVVTRPDGSSFLALGASGGRKIAAAVVQILSLVLDHGLGLQDAVSMPRIDLEGDAILLDARFPESAGRDLASMGHRVERRSEDLSTFEFANPCGVLRDPDGTLTGGVNPFQMTSAVGY